jgi:hypothetical protein
MTMLEAIEGVQGRKVTYVLVTLTATL